MAKLGLGYGRLIGIVALSLLGAAMGCSSNDGESTVEGDGTGARSGSGGGSVTTGGGSGDTTSTGGNGAGNTTSGGRSGSGGSGTGGSGNTSSGGSRPNTEACPGMPANDTTGLAGAAGASSCEGQQYEPERMPVDMFIMLDRSISMIEHTVEVNGAQVTRWQAVTAAVEQFVSDPAASDIRMGLGIFSYTGSDNETVECNAASYAVPKVEIGPPADVGGEIVQYIKDLEATWKLGGFTPTSAALEGAIMHAKEWAAANPMRKTVVVLVTDGMPTQCTVDVAQIADIAAAGQNTEPRISTYVVGVQGAWNLQQIAQEGGTEAFVVGQTGDAAAQFVEALINITDNPISCEYQITDPSNEDMLIDYDKVSIIYTPTATGVTEEVPKANGFGDCANSQYGGWYYDDEAAAQDDDPNTKPSKILVCPCTCARFGVGNMTLRLGCEPKFILG